MKVRIALSTLLLSAAAAQAGTWYVKADATGDGSGTSWANATTSLSAMLAVVQDDSGHEIWVAAGTYRPSTAGLADPRRATFEIPHKTKLYGGFAGTETARDQRNPKVNATVLSGDLLGNDVAAVFWTRGENVRHVVTLVNCDSSTILDGFIITAGYDDRAQWHESSVPGCGDCGFLLTEGQGAGILITGGGPKINDCIFQGNYVRGVGGGLYASASTPSLTNCTFYDNTAWTNTNGGVGGGMALSQCVSNVTNCVFVRNKAARGSGGITAYGTLNLLNCTVFANTGGGMSVGGTVTITNCIVYGNADRDDDTTLTEAQIRYYPAPPLVTYSCVEGGWTAAGAVGNIDADPLFVDTTAGDLHLQAGSPCIDTGNSAAPELPETDREGNARTTASGVDMGAYEYHVQVEPPPADDSVPPIVRLCGAGFPVAVLGCFAGLVVMRRRGC